MHCLPNPRTRFKVPLSGVAEGVFLFCALRAYGRDSIPRHSRGILLLPNCLRGGKKIVRDGEKILIFPAQSCKI